MFYGALGILTTSYEHPLHELDNWMAWVFFLSLRLPKPWKDYWNNGMMAAITYLKLILGRERKGRRGRGKERKRKRNIGCCSTYLCVRWLIPVCALNQRIKPTIVAYQDDAVNHWATWPRLMDIAFWILTMKQTVLNAFHIVTHIISFHPQLAYGAFILRMKKWRYQEEKHLAQVCTALMGWGQSVPRAWPLQRYDLNSSLLHTSFPLHLSSFPHISPSTPSLPVSPASPLHRGDGRHCLHQLDPNEESSLECLLHGFYSS